MRSAAILAVAFVLTSPVHAQLCTGKRLWGPYGMQLSGLATISGAQDPIADLARLTLSYDGTVSGYSSVNFKGLLLGNPASGTYELHPDCTFALSLQDDSGGWQHFRGVATPDGRKITIRQTDPETGERGEVEKAPNGCTASDLRNAYTFTLSGTATPLATGNKPIPFAAAGSLSLDANRKLSLVRPTAASVAYDLQPDCMIQLELPPLTPTGRKVHLRGIVVNSGAKILAIQTDPGEPAAAVFVSR